MAVAAAQWNYYTKHNIGQEVRSKNLAAPFLLRRPEALPHPPWSASGLHCSITHTAPWLGEDTSQAGVRRRKMHKLGVCSDGPRDRTTEEVALGRRDLVDVFLVFRSGCLSSDGISARRCS